MRILGIMVSWARRFRGVLQAKCYRFFKFQPRWLETPPPSDIFSKGELWFRKLSDCFFFLQKYCWAEPDPKAWISIRHIFLVLIMIGLINPIIFFVGHIYAGHKWIGQVKTLIPGNKKKTVTFYISLIRLSKVFIETKKGPLGACGRRTAKF